MIGVVAVFALVGAPILAAVALWRVLDGDAWRSPEDVWKFLERSAVAVMVALSVFSGWLSFCHRVVEALKP